MGFDLEEVVGKGHEKSAEGLSNKLNRHITSFLKSSNTKNCTAIQKDLQLLLVKN